ncbi:MAG: M15 family metallopeptidase [Clostridia bacterium]|nr:M15 family metallopeptidase [Clostridia bacterium]
MRFLRKLTNGLSSKAIWAFTLTLFIAVSVFAVAFGVNAVNRKEPIPVDTYDRIEDYTAETDSEVTTKAPNTGDPVMTTTIIEYTYYETEETTTAETTTAETTTAETTTVVTTTETTTETTTVVTTVPEPEEPTYPEDGDWNKLLVNPWNPIPDGFTPQLVSIGNGQQADYRVKDALNAMLTDCRKAGYNPIVCSSYRTIARQQTLFENETKAFMSYGYDRATAEEFASKWVARPGTSEHHTGLAFDIVSASYQKLDRSQENTPEQKWLMANCHKYGFILRYPDDKTEITGINYEPWHYRYVGLDIAKEIHEKQITLEEYLSQQGE